MTFADLELLKETGLAILRTTSYSIRRPMLPFWRFLCCSFLFLRYKCLGIYCGMTEASSLSSLLVREEDTNGPDASSNCNTTSKPRSSGHCVMTEQMRLR
jgi:hypothetical protein